MTALPLSPDITLAEARRRIADALAAAGLPDAALDARIFLEEATGLSPGGLLGAAGRPLGPAAAATLDAWVARRLAGEPVFRILGHRAFWSVDLAVTPDVLDPRPDTETVVGAALAALGSSRTQPIRVCDLGVGSGAILAALLAECPQARGWGVDRSLAACRVARRNLAQLGFAARAVVLQGFWGDALGGGFDLVVSNPPYIETAVIPTLAPEVRDHDPHLALDGGPDGLDAYRAIASGLGRLLRAGGVTVLEVGAGQTEAVRELCEARGLTFDRTASDLGGHARAVVLRRP